jgi:hypothetical protein
MSSHVVPGWRLIQGSSASVTHWTGESSHTYAWSSSLQHHCLGSVEIKFPIQVLMPQNLGIDSRRDGGDSLRLAARASQLCGSITDGSYPTDVCEACFQAMVTCWLSGDGDMLAIMPGVQGCWCCALKWLELVEVLCAANSSLHRDPNLKAPCSPVPSRTPSGGNSILFTTSHCHDTIACRW